MSESDDKRSKAEELVDKVGGKIQEKTGEAADDHDLKKKGERDQDEAGEKFKRSEKKEDHRHT